MSDPFATAWSSAPSVFENPWRPIVVDVEQPLTDIDTRGIDALHVTAFAGSTPLGRVVIPTSAELCTAVQLRSSLESFDLAAFEARLRRGLDRPAPIDPSASIVICTRNRATRLRSCLESLTGQTADIGEIIVVHNSRDDDGTEAVVADFPARYVREPDLGLDRARNRGAVEAATDIVLYTDDDVALDPSWAQWLLRPFADPQVAAATGLILPAELATAGQIEFERMAGFVRTFEPFVMDGTSTPPASAGRAGAGASMAFRRSFLLDNGGFPEALDAGQPTATGGDTYALYQALQHGYRVAFEPRAVAFHTHRTTPEEALHAVHGYATGVVAYLLEAMIQDRSPAAAAAASRWARSRMATLCRGLVVQPRSRSTRYVRTQVAGIAKAPGALRAARARSRQHAPLITGAGAPVPDPMPPLRAAAGTARSISVIIPTHGRRRSLVDLVESLTRQEYRGEVEIIVATDGPFTHEGQLFEMLGGALDCRVVVGSQNGAGAARNAGAAAATGDLLVFLDDDVVPAHGHVLAAHNAAHEGDPAIAVGPILPIHADGGTLTLASRNWWADQATRLRTSERLDFTDICSGNLSIRRDTFCGLGGFRPLPRQEDYDLGLRALEGGVALRPAPAAEILHDAGMTVNDSITRRRQEGRGDTQLAADHPLAATSIRLGSWDDLSGWTRRAARLGVGAPRAADRAIGILARTVSPLDRLGSRWYLTRIHQLAATISYWAGVGEELGGLDGWHTLKANIDAAVALAPVPVLELTELSSWTPPQAGTASLVTIAHHGFVLGEAPLRWGGTPFDEQRFGASVIHHYGLAAFRVEARLAVAS